MGQRIGGERPRPHVAIIGEFSAGDIEAFYRMFPTVWQGSTMDELSSQVDPREVDLLIIGSGVDSAGNWAWECHVICFSESIGRLPGPVDRSFVDLSEPAETEPFVVPDMSLMLSRRRDADLATLTGVRGWPRLELSFYTSMYTTVPQEEKARAKKIFSDGVVIAEAITQSPLSVVFIRPDEGLGVAWLPNERYSKSKWVEAIVTQWADEDIDSFPDFGDWQSSPEWMTPREMQILSQIEDLEKQKLEAIAKYEKDIAELVSSLSDVSRDVNKGRRRLITAQGDELVDEVALLLEELGFRVHRMDQAMEEGKPKREDLRISDPDALASWEAIVEVRGYARSGGKTRDLLRLSRFADLYRNETGNLPNKRIYIINGQTELPPSRREAPLAASAEDAEIFAQSDGLIIWSLDLYRAINTTLPENLQMLKQSLKRSVGRWEWKS